MGASPRPTPLPETRGDGEGEPRWHQLEQLHQHCGLGLVHLGGIAGGVCLGLSAGIQVASDNARLRSARDARLDAQWLAERLREGQ